MADEEEIVYDLLTEVLVKGASDATYARAVATVSEQGVIDIVGNRRLLRVARDGHERRAHGSSRRAAASASAAADTHGWLKSGRIPNTPSGVDLFVL